MKYSQVLLGLLAAFAINAVYADTYYHRVPAAAKCGQATCVSLSITPGQSSSVPATPLPPATENPAPPAPPTTYPSANLSLDSVSFGSVLMGTTGSPSIVRLNNSGTGPLQISGMSVVDGLSDFGQSNNCDTSLAAGQSCDVSVSFSPTARGIRQGQLAIVTNDKLLTVSLQGTGLQATGTLKGPVDLGDGVVGTAAIYTYSFTNTGDVPLTGFSVTLPTEFVRRTNTCGASTPVTLNMGASCSISVSYTRTQPGAWTGALKFTSTAFTSPLSIPLTAAAHLPSTTLSGTTTMAFEDTTVGQISSSKSVTLSNTSNHAVPVTVSVGTGLAVVANNGCGTSLAAGSSCNIQVAFKPSDVGVLRDTVFIRTDDKTYSVATSGKGIAYTDSVAITPNPIAITQTIGTPTAPTIITVRNNGTRSVTFTKYSVALEFYISFTDNFCQNGMTLAPGAVCTFGLVPQTNDSLNTWLGITLDQYNYQIPVTLTSK